MNSSHVFSAVLEHFARNPQRTYCDPSYGTLFYPQFIYNDRRLWCCVFIINLLVRGHSCYNVYWIWLPPSVNKHTHTAAIRRSVCAGSSFTLIAKQWDVWACLQQLLHTLLHFSTHNYRAYREGPSEGQCAGSDGVTVVSPICINQHYTLSGTYCISV